jgi:hypothetical protein
MEFEVVGSEERNMGPENEYQAEEYFECDECGREIKVTFRIWEYPVGIHNYDEVSIDGASLISCFDFSIDFDDEPELDCCEECGEPFVDKSHTGICDKCIGKIQPIE